MDVTIEQYRARIGSHANFIKQKEIASRLEGNFWNMMLIFYMNVFYLPTLKRFGEQFKNI